MIKNFFFPYNASIKFYRAKNIGNRIWPKRPALHLQLAKTSCFTPSAGQNVLLYTFSWPKRPALHLQLAKTSCFTPSAGQNVLHYTFSWPKRPASHLQLAKLSVTKRPALHLQLAKTSCFTPSAGQIVRDQTPCFTPSAGQNVLLYTFSWPKRPWPNSLLYTFSWPKRPWPKRPALHLQLAKTSVDKTFWAKRSTFVLKLISLQVINTWTVCVITDCYVLNNFHDFK